jgi:hypothetical protein
MSVLHITRTAAVASLVIFIVSLPLVWIGVVPPSAKLPLVMLTTIALFGSTAAYILSFSLDFSRATEDESELANSKDPSMGPVAAEVKSLLAWKDLQSAGLRIWAGLISILVLGVIGSLVSPGVGVAGTAVGAALTLVAVAGFVRSLVRFYRTRQDLWVALGRRRWQFVAYMIATVAWALAAGVGRYLYHSKAVTGAAIVVALFLLIRLRLFMQELW